VKQIQVVGEFPSGVATYGGLSTINQAFVVKQPVPAGAAK
jgi:hypothetical protein